MHINWDLVPQPVKAKAESFPPESPISKGPYIHDCHAANASEEPFIPHFRLPDPRTCRMRGNLPIIERSISPASTASSRRSVSSMKQLLPLKLRAPSPQPKTDLVTLIESTIPTESNLKTCSGKLPTTHDLRPSVSSFRDDRLSCDRLIDRVKLSSISYESRPGTGSPKVSPVCAINKKIYSHGFPVGTDYDEPCIPGRYDNAHHQTCFNEGYPSYYSGTIEPAKKGTIETPMTSVNIVKPTEASIITHEELVPQDDTPSIKDSMSSWVENGSHDSVYGAEFERLDEEQHRFQNWLDSESSRSSSSFSNDEVFDALVTKLAPAKAQVVELNGTLQQLPELTKPSVSSAASRPATPYSFLRKEEAARLLPLLTLHNTTWTMRKGKQKQYGDTLSSLSPASDPPSEEVRCQSGTHYIESSSSVDSVDNFHTPLYNDIESESIEIATSIIDTIDDVLHDFPHQMLFIDTPCIVDIRHQNNVGRRTRTPQHSYDSPRGCSIYSLKQNIAQRPLPQRRARTSFFRPFIHVTTNRNSLFRKKDTPCASSPLSSTSMAWNSLDSPPDPSPPDLSILQHVFPNTLDWLRRALYAHLLAFNHVHERHLRLGETFRSFPSKACRTLGISRTSSRNSESLMDINAKFLDLEEKLESCITWIVNRMIVKSPDQKHVKRMRSEYERDHILIKALAEIVKASEIRCQGATV